MGRHTRLVFVMPFADLLAMQTIGCRAGSQETGPSDDFDRSTSLHRPDLRLEYSGIGIRRDGYILEHTGGLRSVYYEYGGATFRSNMDFLLSEFWCALLWYCKSTLERLTLATAYDGRCDYGNFNDFVGSLREFEVLKTVDM